VETDSAEKDWSQDIDVLCIQVVPGLTIAIKGSTTINIYVVSTELEEGSGILESLVECILLPVISVVRELNRALDI
jgi:hypothetical protein